MNLAPKILRGIEIMLCHKERVTITQYCNLSLVAKQVAGKDQNKWRGKMNKLATVFLSIIIGGCVIDRVATQGRIDALEARVAVLEKYSSSLADASIKNSQAIKTNSQSIELLGSAIRETIKR